MIRLYSPLERVVMVSPERITHVKPDHERPERTRVYFDNDYITVMDSVEEVARKVLEWRLAMVDYRHSVGEYKMLTRNVLEELAGLEEPKNG